MELHLTQERDKTFPKSENMNRCKLTFMDRCFMTITVLLCLPLCCLAQEWSDYIGCKLNLTDYGLYRNNTEANRFRGDNEFIKIIESGGRYRLHWSDHNNNNLYFCHIRGRQLLFSPKADMSDAECFELRGRRGEELFTVSNVNTYRYFKAERVTIAMLLAKRSGLTHSNITPMGTHYENKHVTTDADRSWLSNAANNPSNFPGNASWQWKRMEVTLYPSGFPTPFDAVQRSVPDCCAIAFMASLAYRYPKYIMQIIKPNGENYDVRMFDPQGKPVTVSVSPTFMADESGTLTQVRGENGQCTWATILEKAMVKWESVYKVDYDIYGIGTEFVAALFLGSGDSFAFYPGDLHGKEYKEVVDWAFNNGYLIVGGFAKSILIDGNNMPHPHAMTYMRGADGELFRMRNPWNHFFTASGACNAQGRGIIAIPDDPDIWGLIDMRIMSAGYAKE